MRRHDRREVVELALSAQDLERAVLLYRHAGGVVAAVFQPTQAAHQQRQGLAGADVSDDPAHVLGQLLLRDLGEARRGR